MPITPVTDNRLERPTETDAYRVRFVNDDDAHFEECDGGTEPLTPEAYAENPYRACPDHPRGGSKVIDTTTSPPTVGCGVCGRTDYVDIDYDEYRAYYGDPDSHVYIGCVVDKRCGHCGVWDDGKASVWGVDMMIDSPDLDAVTLKKAYTPAEARALPGYLGEVARDVLDEAGYQE